MSSKSVWTSGFAAPKVIAVELPSAGLPIVKANAQQASAESAEVKIDNRFLAACFRSDEMAKRDLRSA